MRSVRAFLVSPLISLLKYLIPKLNLFITCIKHVLWFVLSFILIFIAAGLITVNYLSLDGYPLVRTKLGVIRGLQAPDGDYSMFMGIPYAKVNETNPFGNAVPYPPFREVYNAHDDSAVCPQLEEHHNTIVGTLDCLHVNVYVPNAASTTNRLPVLVFIFGGRYEVGSPGRFIYGPKFLVRHNIVLVTLNYRLGPYGFQCLGTPEVPGNQGLKDQVMALKWIKDNIEDFGGDSNRITLVGESSGGQSVDFHIIYGEERLFEQAIIGAGASLDRVTMFPSKTIVPLELANDLGFQTSSVNEALTFLSKQPTDSVIKSSNRLNVVYGPCVEKKFDDVESFITEFPKTEIGNIKHISLMIGQSASETMHVFANENLDTFKYKYIFEQKLIEYFGFEHDQLKNMAEYVRQFYIGDQRVNERVKPQIADFYSDLFQNYPTKRKIEQYMSHDAKRIYFAMFAYNGRRNYMKLLKNVDLNLDGVSHMDELGYLFDVSYMNEPITANDQLIIDRMTTLWANFVKYSDPTPETTDLLPVKCEPVKNELFPYLNIDLELSMMYAPFRERMKFWDSFFEVNATRCCDGNRTNDRI